MSLSLYNAPAGTFLSILFRSTHRPVRQSFTASAAFVHAPVYRLENTDEVQISKPRLLTLCELPYRRSYAQLAQNVSALSNPPEFSVVTHYARFPSDRLCETDLRK